MASYTVDISSDGLRQPAGNIQFSFPKALDMTKGVWEVGCVLAGIWYSWFNVSAAAGNNTFTYFDGTSSYTGILRDGVYTAVDLIEYIYLAIEGGTSEAVANSITLEISQISLGFTLTLTNGCQLDLSAGGTSQLYRLFGADPINYTTQNVLIYFTGQADITGGYNQITVRLPGLIQNNTLNGVVNNILFSLIPEGEPGSLLNYNPAFPIFSEISSQQLTSINVQVCNQLGQIIDFNTGANYQNNPTYFRFLFRERR